MANNEMNELLEPFGLKYGALVNIHSWTGGQVLMHLYFKDVLWYYHSEDQKTVIWIEHKFTTTGIV